MLNLLRNISYRESEAIKMLLPILVFMVGNFVYDFNAPKYSDDVPDYVHTNWNIFYSVMQYSSFIIFCYLNIQNSNGIYKAINWVFLISFSIRILFEFFEINQPFPEYINSINAIEKSIFVLATVIAGLILVISFYSYKKRHK